LRGLGGGDEDGDGGENWGISQIGLSANLKAIFFSELNSGYCTGSNGIIIKTTNSGLNWINILNPSNMNAILESVFFINEDTGFVSGDQYLRTTNSGLNWELFSGSGRSIYFTDSYTGYRTGGGGIITKTTNTGLNWTVQNGNVSSSLNSIYFLNNTNGIAVGNSGSLTKTTDGGITWIPQTKITNNDLQSVSFNNSNTGFITGNFGTILKTTNGGLVFIIQNENVLPDNFLLSQNFPNPFNSSTVIKYKVKYPTDIGLKLYNIEGKELMTLVNDFQEAGIYEILFDASELNSGIYFYSLFKNNVLSDTKKLTLIK
jgi:photosystem II stability/assembly factor-like uncharacterized protein